MLELRKEQKELLIEQTRRMLDRAEAGMSTRDIMAHIYVEGLDGKTLEQGQMMADAIMESVAAFDSQYVQAQNNMSSWLDDSLNDMVKDMTAAEKCACWMKIAAAVTAADEALENGGSIDREKILGEIEDVTITEEQATAELEQELYNKAKAAIENSNVMMAALVAQEEAMERIDSSDAAAGLLLDLGSREVNFRAVASMIAYTNIKNGTFENIPVDMKLEQITTLVCAEIEQMRILSAVEEGKMPLETAKMLLSILGALAIVCLLPTAIGINIAVVSSLTSGLASIPVGAAGFLLMLHGMNEAFNWWNKQADRMVENSAAEIQQVNRGTKKLLSYLRETAIPEIKKHVHTVLTWLRKIVLRGKDGTAAPESVELDTYEANPDAPEEEDITDEVEWVPVD